MTTAHTAVVVMAYGTPRSREDILPYYTDIRRGRAPTPELLKELEDRYEAIGGLSPLAQITDAQADAIQRALNAVAPGEYHVVLGLKHAKPFVEDAVHEVARLGIKKIVGVVLAPHFSSYSIGQYMGRVRDTAVEYGIEVRGVESWATEPAYVDFLARDMKEKLTSMPERTKVLFTAHSLPQRIIDGGDPYPDELRSTAEAVASQLGLSQWSQWSIAWQSAGRTPEPWIGPDILAVIDDFAATRTTDEPIDGVLVSACGFVADHLEVLYDLDIEAANHARARGLSFARTVSVNDDATVMAALAARVISA